MPAEHGEREVGTSYLRSRKYPGGARVSCADSFSTPSNEGKFSCRAVTGSLVPKHTGKIPDR